MRFFLSVLFLILFSSLFGQIAPFIDFSGYLKSFYKSNVRTLEMQRINSFKSGDNIMAYVDGRGNFKVFEGVNYKEITPQDVKFSVSDNYVAYSVGNTLYGFNNGVNKLLTYNSGDYLVTDSLIVFQDTRFKQINVYYKGEVITISQQVGGLSMPESIGENCLMFKDYGDVYKYFMFGKVHEIEASNQPILGQSGTSIICFNDPVNRTFTVIDNGLLMDIESVMVKKYKAGRGFISYEDNNGNIWMYNNLKKIEISNFYSSLWEVKDDLIVWDENNNVFTFYQGKKLKVCSYLPKDFILKNGVFVFTNINGGVDVYKEGKVYNITNQIGGVYTVYGNSVLVELFNKSFRFFNEGEFYDN